jgi:hypothetical protein
MKKTKGSDSAAKLRRLAHEELERVNELHEPPMPPAKPAITLPPERRHVQRRKAVRDTGRHAGRRTDDAFGQRRFIV